MKNLIILFACLFSAVAYSQSPTTDTAVICVYRPNLLTGSAFGWNIYINGRNLCKVKNKKQVMIEYPAGELFIYSEKSGIDIQDKKIEGITVRANPGDTIYIEGKAKTSLTRMRLELSRVFPEQYAEDGRKLEIDVCQEAK